MSPGPPADVLLAIVVEGIATERIPLATLEDVAALYTWLTVIVPTAGPPIEPVTTPDIVQKIRQNYAR